MNGGSKKSARNQHMVAKDIKQFQFKKGESGNPSGKPKGTRSIKSIINELGDIEYDTPEELKAMYPNAKYTAKELAIMAIFAKSIKGDVQAFTAWADRLEGKPKQDIEANVTTQSKLPDGLTKEELLRLAGLE